MQFRNLKIVDHIVFGRGSFNQLDEIIAPHRKGDFPMIFFLDHFFEGKPLASRVPLRGKDKIVFVDVTYEPKTTQVDALAASLKAEFGEVSGIIGIGGGSTMDLAKAVALMMTNPGSSADYQGWDLVKQAGVYKVGIPTLSGTGAEVSRTTVLTGPTRKLGMNSDFTPFDQIVLDPELTKDAPANQFWSITIYDNDTRCIIQNEQGKSDISSVMENIKVDADGSTRIFVGEKAPEGYENNWIQSNPNKGFFAYLRLYGPLESYYDKSWIMPNIKKMK